MEKHGSCFGAPTTNLDAQLAKNWQIKERYRVKFAMDFFDLFNHPNFNSNGLEGTGYAPSSLYCGGSALCGATNPNHVVSSTCDPAKNPGGCPAPVSGFGNVSGLQTSRGSRELQYSLKFQF
jgi:hypothetical protein